MGSGITQTKRGNKDCRRSANETLRERKNERKRSRNQE